MLGKVKRYGRQCLKRLPFIGKCYERKELQTLFSVELALINGNHCNENKHPSIIHFSINKSATQYTKGILQRCGLENGMWNVNIHDYAWRTNFPYLDLLSANEMQNYQHIFQPRGYVYNVFGGFVEGIKELEKYKVILMVRDPRDILVSNYYSSAYSHPKPSKWHNKYKNFMEQRSAVRKIPLDEYAVAYSQSVFDVFYRYKILLLDKYQNVYMTTYEKMVSDFSAWVKDLLNACQLSIDDNMMESILKENDRLRPKKENIYRHLRQGKSGDYKEKLSHETIRYLNQKFSSILTPFGYI